MSFPRRRSIVPCLGLILAIAGISSDPLYAQGSTAPPKTGNLAFWEELAFWEAIKDSKDPAEFETYLTAYPQGRFASLAELRFNALTKDSGPDNAEEPAETTPDGEASAKPPWRTFQDCPDCPLMVELPAGSFMMGSEQHRKEEKPEHEIAFGGPFAIGVYEVTIGEWDACLREGGCSSSPAEGGDGNLPVSNVSWDDAQQYTHWLSVKTGKEYRLPTEAEWEYAARGGAQTAFWWGHEAGAGKANCSDCGSAWDGESPAPVGSFEPNPFGLHDVHGNLWEWTLDCMNGSYQGAPADGSAWLRGDCIYRILRGGSWRLGSEYMRTSRRYHYDRDVRYYLHGFRVVRSLP